MRTETNLYYNTHGMKPKGSGSWWLEVTGTDNKGRFTTETYNVKGTLTEAKKAAVTRLKNEVGAVKRVVEITVLP